MQHCFFPSSADDAWVLSTWALMKDAMNIRVQVWCFVLNMNIGVEFLSHTFPFWGTVRLFVQSSCTISHSHQQCRRVTISSHPCQRMLSVCLISRPTYWVWSRISLWLWFVFPCLGLSYLILKTTLGGKNQSLFLFGKQGSCGLERLSHWLKVRVTCRLCTPQRSL